METRAGMFILRLGLGLYLLLWSVSHLADPGATQATAMRVLGMHLSSGAAYGIGVAEIALSVAFLIGVWKTGIYVAAALLYAASSLGMFRQLLHPFEREPQAFAALPILAGFVALFLLRDKDSLWTV